MPSVSDLVSMKEFTPMKDTINKETLKVSPKGNLKIPK